MVDSWVGTTAKVATPGDCLNLRAEPRPDAQVRDCLADGSVVLRNSAVTEAGGTLWASVTTLGRTGGWVAEQFLAAP